MILIAENINVMSKTVGQAIRERLAQPIQQMAITAGEEGADFLELNIGPAMKDGDELMAWLVDTVQDVADKPLSLDTTNHLATEAGLKRCRRRAIINSVSLQPERIENMLPLVTKYNASMVGLLWGPEGMPRDANERCMLAVNLVYEANKAGVSSDDIWIDPIVTPVSVEINQVKSCVEFMTMLEEVVPGCHSIVGLSNISSGTPAPLRPYLNRTFLMMLMRYGLYAAIVDIFDRELVSIARGERNSLVGLVHQVMDGNVPDLSILSQEEVKYVKTARVLSGEVLYSHSWLEV